MARFGEALLLQQPPLTLDAFLARLLGPDPAQRDAAAAAKKAYEDGQLNAKNTRSLLNACVKALSEVPREQRMLTLEQALHLKLIARALKTLLPEEDLRLLQQVLAAAGTARAQATERKQVLLIRLGVVLRARGHGGLAGWLQMHHAPDGARRASALLDRLKNEPRLQLGQTNAARLERAVAELRTCLPAPQAPDDLPLCDPGAPTEGDLAWLDTLHHREQMRPGAVASPDDLLRDFGSSPGP